jgi:hypothetical protein
MNQGSDRFKDDWRRARVQVLAHIRLSETWSDIMQGVDVLAYISLKAKPLIAEQEMFEDKNKTKVANRN